MNLITLIVSIIVTVLIFLSGRGSGLGSAWGGGGESFQTRRGVEKVLLNATILFVIVFLIISVINLVL